MLTFFSSKLRFVFRFSIKIFVVVNLLCASVAAERLPTRVYTTADGLGSSAVNTLLYDSRGFLWFGTRDGLSRFDGYRFTNYKLGTGEEAATASIFYTIERRNGDYLIAEQNGNVYRFNAQTTVSESSIDGSLTLNAEKINARLPGKILEDSDGVLWAINAAGLHQISESDGNFTLNPPLPISLPDQKAVSIFYFIEDREKTFWLTTDRGVVRITKDGRVLAFYTTPPPSAVRPYTAYIFADQTGRIWISSQDGLFVLKPGPINDQAELPPRQFVENIGNKLPAKAGEIGKFTTTDGLNGQIIKAFQQTADGRIWIATEGGLTVFDGDKFRNYATENGLGEFLNCIAADGQGNLWMGSLSGVFKLVINGFSTFANASGFAHGGKPASRMVSTRRRRSASL